MAKQDPTRTMVLRRRFMADLERRFRQLKKDTIQLVDTDDVFGLTESNPFTFNVEKQAWRFRTDDKKVDAFNLWFKEQVDAGILEVNANLAQPWTAEYVDSAYKKGAMRAYTDTRAADLDVPADFAKGSRAEFLRSAFGGPEAVSKIRLLSTRTFEELKGITAVMSQQVSRVLVDGLVHGKHPSEIARTISKTISGISKIRARVLARTEIIRAHAEGQLDSFEKLGVDELEAIAEWSTAGDDRVCTLCAPLEGTVMSVKEARGLIPRHPNCRCAWKPAGVGQKRAGRAWKKKDVDARIEASLKAELPKSTKDKSVAAAKSRSVWAGKEVEIRERLGKVPAGTSVIPKSPTPKPVVKKKKKVKRKAVKKKKKA